MLILPGLALAWTMNSGTVLAEPGKLTVIMRDKTRPSRVAPLGQGSYDRITLPATVGEAPQQPARLLRPMLVCCRSALDRTLRRHLDPAAGPSGGALIAPLRHRDGTQDSRCIHPARMA
jgi:hypothetical protein